MVVAVGALTVAVAAAAVLSRPPLPPGSSTAQPSRGRTAAPSGAPSALPPLATPARDVFRYADEGSSDEAVPRTPVRVITADPPPALTPPVPSPVRLIGFVRTAGTLKAALWIEGEVVVLGLGDEASGYALVALDEDLGVRVKTSEGKELTLSP